jgi:AraC family transcriptional regulator, arabinose operon regulatory protein
MRDYTIDTSGNKDDVLICGYSYHIEPFYSNYDEGTKQYLLRLQTESIATVRIHGQWIQLEPGDLLLLGPDEPYQIQIIPTKSATKHKVFGCGDYYLLCNNSWMVDWWNAIERKKICRIPLEDGILGIWKQLVLEKQKGEATSQEILNYLLRALCLSIDRILVKPYAVPSRRPSIIAYQIKNYIEMHVETSFTLESLSRHVVISISNASQIFKTHFGKTIMEYAIELRLRLAVERMSSSHLTLEQIAESAGFHSYSYFYRVFRERYGISPKKYRNELTIIAEGEENDAR